ncbi:putative cupredoxin [Lupinus albus]|uniref:Putative cupredoxin n=1 Tax=Lupinus albus TaxID=3870 RepID=A0A6A4PLP0_LUPAL|nr:putative cupredoxin [Lupinus albus]
MATKKQLPLRKMKRYKLIICFDFVVGGSKDQWKVPLQSPDSLNRWAEAQRFRIGDTLVFKYDNSTESVHLVNEEDYLACNTLRNHTILKDGNSKFNLMDSGPFHFISGSQGHCQMGLKLVVVVMSHRPAANGTVHSPPISLALPSPALSPSINQAVLHTSGTAFTSVIMGLGSFIGHMIIFELM